MTLRDDITDSFGKKGLKFVSLNESTSDPQKSTLVYIDGAGASVKKEISIRISELEETVSTIDLIDPEGLADFLLK
ncbi:MAG: hypothetical protein OK454_09340 [Thaumarchaeota archaeon]|nr:hypothetical protein [Nitrososphaerota archaeon]MDA4136283.1 hypothetical protein [Nitrososphaerota archaeon]